MATSVRVQWEVDGLSIVLWEEGRDGVFVAEDADTGTTSVPVGANFLFRFNYTQGQETRSHVEVT